jgi:hypothetical protein
VKTLHCGISGLPIFPGDDILAYVLAEDSAQRYRLATPPIRGTLASSGKELLLAPTLFESACARKAGFDLAAPMAQFLACESGLSAFTEPLRRLGIARADAWANVLALPARIESRADDCDVASLAEECASLAAKFFPLAEKAMRIPSIAKMYAECERRTEEPAFDAAKPTHPEREIHQQHRARLAAFIYNGYLVDSLYDSPVFYELLSCENVIQETKSPFFSMGATLDILTIDMPESHALASDYADAIRACALAASADKTLGLLGKPWQPAELAPRRAEPALQSLWARSVSGLAEKTLREFSEDHSDQKPIGLQHALAQSEKAELESIGKIAKPSKSI